MLWPPIKAWTSISSINGQKYFVAINYGGQGENRWVNLVSVLDGETRFKTSWINLNDPSKWLCGWPELSQKTPVKDLFDEDSYVSSNANHDLEECLHPSPDSGLDISVFKKINNRPWFEY